MADQIQDRFAGTTAPANGRLAEIYSAGEYEELKTMMMMRMTMMMELLL